MNWGRFIFSMVLGWTLVAGTDPARGATFMVDSASDGVDVNPGDGICDAGGGVCTARAAVMESNRVAGPDTIVLPSGYYALTVPVTIGGARDAGGRLTLTDSVVMRGASARDTIIDANWRSGVIDVGDYGYPATSPNITVAIAGVTIMNGDSTIVGAGVRNGYNVDLTLTGVVVRNNAAYTAGGGIHNQGRLVIIDSTIADNGGVEYGGGIANVRPSRGLELTNVTVSGNRASRSGGGIYHEGSDAAPFTVTGSTIANNQADDRAGGVYNAAGMASNPPLRLRATVVADNAAPYANDCLDRQDPSMPNTISDGYVLIEDPSTCAFVAGADDLVGTDPKLGPLADNGGSVPTQMPAADSPLVAAIEFDPQYPPAWFPFTDARGAVRPVLFFGLLHRPSTIGAVDVTCGNGMVDAGETCEGEACCNPVTCDYTPIASCEQPLAPQASRLTIKKGSTTASDSFAWTWTKGPAHTLADFGFPLTQTSYQLCVFDQAGLVTRLDVVGGSPNCGSAVCWKATATQYRFLDKLAPTGVRSLSLRSGSTGRSSIALKGRGSNLLLPTLPLAAPLSVQLTRTDLPLPICWRADFASYITSNTATGLAAKSE